MKFFNKIIEKLKSLSLLEMFLLSSPFLDLLTSFSIHYLKTNITVGIIAKFVFLLVLVHYLIFKAKSTYKTKIFFYLSLIFIYYSFFMFNTYITKGSSYLILETVHLGKMFFAPISFALLLIYIQENKSFEHKNVLKYIFYLYIICIALPNIFGLTYSSYSSGKVGNVGLFYSPNEISAILSILFPFALSSLMENAKKIYGYILFIFYTYFMLIIGTKVPLIAIFLTIVSYFIILFVRKYYQNLNLGISKFNWKTYFNNPFIAPTLVVIFLMAPIMWYSPSTRNIKSHLNTIEQSQDNGEDVDYSNVVFSSRDRYNQLVGARFERASFNDKLLGMGRQVTDNEKDNVVEIDYLDILYNYGIIGLYLYLIPIVIITKKIIVLSFKNIKKTIFDPFAISALISLSLMFGIAFFAGHVFSSPSVSVYFSIISIALYLKLLKNNINSENLVHDCDEENILGVKVSNLTYTMLKESIVHNIANKIKTTIIAINPEKILKARQNNELKQLLNESTYKIPDGIGVVIASKIQSGNIKKRITGIDSMEMLCDLSNQNRFKVFLYGAKNEILISAREKIIAKYPNINIVGYVNGYEKNNQIIIEMINKSNADIVFVALGSPKQELWIRDNMDKVNATIFQGVGGSFDVFSGNIKRAPLSMQNLGLEWLYRLVKEPKRIFRQMKLLKFIFLIMIGKKD